MSQPSSSAGASSGLFGFFTNRKINAKIMIGFAAVLALTAALSVTSYRGFGKVSEGFATFRQRVAVVGIARDVDREFVAFRRFVREFSLSGDEGLIAEARKQQERVTAHIKKGLDTYKVAERHKKMEEIGQKFEGYSKDFDKLVALKLEQNKLVKEVLDPLGLKSRVEIEELQSRTAAKSGNTNNIVMGGEALKQLLLARLNVNKLLGRHEQGAADGAEKALADLKIAMKTFGAAIDSDEIRKVFVDINANVEKYTEAYHKAAHNAQEIDTLVNGEMSKMAQTVAADAESIKQTGVADQEKIGEDAAETMVSTESLILTIAIGSMLLGIALAWLIGRVISRPVINLTAMMGELAGGNVQMAVPHLDRGDEVGLMAKSVQVFKDNMIETERMRSEQAETEKKQLEQRKADMMKLADQFEGAVGEIVETVSSSATELEASAGSLTSTAGRAQEITTAVAAASEEASTNVSAVASATEEMASSVNEIGRQVQEAAKIAGEAVSQMKATNERIDELSKSASRIGDVVELISTIAGQTNLLALNATIEAARAGEAGRGFAVVASEVKALAEQTAKATGDISHQVSGIQTATQDSVNAMKEIAGTINRISEISSTIASAVEEQGAATREISRNVQEAAIGTQQVSSNITDVQRGASETGSASSQVLSAAQLLSRDSNRLKLEVANFLSSVRAA